MIINTKSYEVPLRYVELSPDRIFNWLDPVNVTAGHLSNKGKVKLDWWSEDTIEIRKFFARNWTKQFDKITNHFSRLEESIKKDGILMPISVVSGPPRDQFLNKTTPRDRFPPEYHEDATQLIYTHPFGGSRLSVALKLGIEKIPCIVHDFSNLFPDATEVTTSNFQNWFGDDYFFSSSPPYVRLSKHSHIIEGAYSGMNQNTREAQLAAVQIARELTYAKYGLTEPTS